MSPERIRELVLCHLARKAAGGEFLARVAYHSSMYVVMVLAFSGLSELTPGGFHGCTVELEMDPSVEPGVLVMS